MKGRSKLAPVTPTFVARVARTGKSVSKLEKDKKSLAEKNLILGCNFLKDWFSGYGCNFPMIGAVDSP